ncbi:DivIVA domain-containing protein, partial [Streptomyces nanshensis]
MGASPHGFTVVRGRGYRPEQVDEALDGLFGEQEEARARLARLVAEQGELTAETERLRALAATLPPPAYESLGAHAGKLLTLAESEAADVRAAAEADAART